MLELSPSRISTFLDCPLKYRYDTDKQVRAIWGRPKPYLFLANAVHGALRDLYRGGGPSRFDWSWLRRQYARAWQDLDWQAQGFETREQAVSFFRLGETMLEGYWERHQGESARPILIEQTVGEVIEGVRFFGRIDRIDQKDDGTLEIIDYKTGRQAEQEGVADSIQLGLYSVLVARKFRPPRVIVSHYYLQSQTKMSKEPDEPEERQLGHLLSIAGSIEGAVAFPPRPNRFCRNCEYSLACPAMAASERPAPDDERRLERTADLCPDVPGLAEKLSRLRSGLAYDSAAEEDSA